MKLEEAKKVAGDLAQLGRDNNIFVQIEYSFTQIDNPVAITPGDLVYAVRLTLTVSEPVDESELKQAFDETESVAFFETGLEPDEVIYDDNEMTLIWKSIPKSENDEELAPDPMMDLIEERNALQLERDALKERLVSQEVWVVLNGCAHEGYTVVHCSYSYESARGAYANLKGSSPSTDHRIERWKRGRLVSFDERTARDGR